MALQTISQVAKSFEVSTRTLRYYEQIGLLPSVRTLDYAYRTYDEATVARLRQIMLLRKLRIPLKEIRQILLSEDAAGAIRAFENKVNELDREIAALETIRSVLDDLIRRLREQFPVRLDPALLTNERLCGLIDSLSVSKNSLKEERSMEDLNRADGTLAKLTDIRIVTLPPATVAASHYVGDDPEYRAGLALDRFVLGSGLCERKPDLRHYGFNHPNPVDESGAHGYEMWITIPDDMEVPPPLEKKRFAGGLYAAHMIQMGNFHEWEWMFDWITGNETYAFHGDMADNDHMCGLLEEHLNYISHVRLGPGNAEPEGMQLDLLMPIRAKAPAR